MKRLAVILILLAAAAASASAQTDSSGFSVQSFRKLDWDLDARSNYPVLDQNSRKAALIKVVIPEDGFDFDVGVMGVVSVKQEVGEIWVYVPEGVRKITIRHRTYGIIRDYKFECHIESASVYEMRLHVPSPPQSTVTVRDSIIYVPTPVETPRVRKRLGFSVLTTGSIPGPAFGIMSIWNPGRFGAYLKVSGNLKSSRHSYVCHEDGTAGDGYIWTDGESRVSRTMWTAGGTYRCHDWLRLCAGAGYGERILLWKDFAGSFAKVEEASAQGIAADLGVDFSLGRFAAYIGVSTVSFRRFFPEIGLGISF